MSHQIELITQLAERLDKIYEEIFADDGQPKADPSAHKDMIFSEITALERAIGPIFASLTYEDEVFQASLSKSQASFLTNHLTNTMMLITAGLKTRLKDHKLNKTTDGAIDALISLYGGSDDYPVTVKDMLAKGKVDELKEILAQSLKNAAKFDADKVFTQIAELAISRSSATAETTHVISLFHDVVEVGIGGHQKMAASSSKAPVEKTLIGKNVIQVNFGSSRVPAKEIKAKPEFETLAK